MSDMKAVLYGAAAGGVVGLGLGVIALWAVDRQVTATLEREVPPQIRAELDRKLGELGITPQVAASLRQAVTSLDQAGLFSVLGGGAQGGVRGIGFAPIRQPYYGAR